jgi:group I intron endonuclease
MHSDKKQGLYCFFFPNGKKYVGIVYAKGKTFAQRLTQHKYLMNHGNRRAVYCALRCFGWDNVEKKLLVESSDESYLKQLETSLIDVWKLNKAIYGEDALGYNLTAGGDGISGYKHTPEVCKEISNRSKGKKMSSETREALRIANTGRLVSQETRNKISESNKKNNKAYLTPEWLEKQRLSHLGKKLSEETIDKRMISWFEGLRKNRVSIIQNKETNETRQGLLTEMCRELNICYKNIKGRGHSKGWVLLNVNI